MNRDVKIITSPVFSRTQVLSLGIGLSLSLLGTAWLLKDLDRTSQNQSLESFAQLTHAPSPIKRKEAGRFNWEQALPGQGLKLKDSIHTGNAGTTSIHIRESNQTIELGPDTLVVLDRSQKFPVQFLSGSAILRNATGADQKIEVKQGGELDIKELPVKLLSPLASQEIWVLPGAKAQVEFQWKLADSDPARVKRTLQIHARTRDLLLTRSPLASRQNRFQSDIGAGVYEWQIGSATDQEPAEIRTLIVREAHPFELTQPVADSTVEIQNEQTDILFSLRAARVQGLPESETPKVLRLEFSRERDFSRIEKTSETSRKDGILRARSFAPGRWYARPIAEYPGQFLANGKPISFEVKKINWVPYTWISPKEQTHFEKAVRIRLQWRTAAPLPEQAKTTVSVRRLQADATAEPPLSFEATGESVELMDLPAGELTAEVRIEHEGEVISKGESLKLTVFEGSPLRITRPEAKWEQRFWKKPDNFDLEWQSDSLVAAHENYHYRVETREQSLTGSKEHPARTLKTRKTSVSWSDIAPLKQGTYQWRVQVLDEQDRVLKSSEPRRLTLDLPPLLPAPAAEGVEPRFNQALDYIRMGGRFEVRWPAVSGARSYLLKVISKTNAGKVVYDGNVSENSRSFEALKEGVYSWSVRAVDTAERPGAPLEDQLFRVTWGEPLNPPRLSDKLFGTTVEAAALRAPAQENQSLQAPRLRSQEVQ
jgi:hypothetical protein